jgi:hypothetical protein
MYKRKSNTEIQKDKLYRNFLIWASKSDPWLVRQLNTSNEFLLKKAIEHRVPSWFETELTKLKKSKTRFLEWVDDVAYKALLKAGDLFEAYVFARTSANWKRPAVDLHPVKPIEWPEMPEGIERWCPPATPDVNENKFFAETDYCSLFEGNVAEELRVEPQYRAFKAYKEERVVQGVDTYESPFGKSETEDDDKLASIKNSPYTFTDDGIQYKKTPIPQEERPDIPEYDAEFEVGCTTHVDMRAESQKTENFVFFEIEDETGQPVNPYTEDVNKGRTRYSSRDCGNNILLRFLEKDISMAQFKNGVEQGVIVVNEPNYEETEETDDQSETDN